MKQLMLIFLLFIFCSSSFAQEPFRRLALVVGANDGGKDRVKLQYAAKDAQAMAKILTELGGVNPEDLNLVVNPDAKTLLKQLQALKNALINLKNTYKRTEVVFYYSGHSDEKGFLLGNSHLKYEDFKKSVDQLNADVRVVILDSCASGVMIRLKGGKMKPPFMVDNSMKMSGYVLLTSSSHDEASQEADSIRGSFFTHYLLTGLRGAADLAQDKKITLNEAYQFAYYETLQRTEKTLSGAQHPGYEIQMSGAGDLVLTDVRQSATAFEIPAEISGRLSIRTEEGVFVAELNKTEGRSITLGLEGGRYILLLDKNRQLSEAKITLDTGKLIVLKAEDFKTASVTKNTGKGIDEKEYRLIPFSFTVLPGISTGSSDQYKVIHNFSLNLLADYSDKLHGFGFGGLNIAGEEFKGLLLNYGGTVIKGSGTGVVISAAFNYAESDFSGALFAGGFTYAENMTGLQLSVLNMAGDVRGTQIGVLNIAGNVRGLQLGLINIAEESSVPIGLINIVRNGQYHINYTIDETHFQSLSFKMGSRHAYSLLSAAVRFHNTNPLDNDFNLTRFGVGIGANIRLSGFLVANTELLHEWTIPHNNNHSYNGLSRFRIGAVIEFNEYFGIVGGISYNLYVNKENINEIYPVGAFSKSSSDISSGIKSWPGFYFGIQVF